MKAQQLNLFSPVQEIPPHRRHGRTSVEAERLAAPKFTRHQKMVLACIHDHQGLTDEEGQELMGMAGNSYRSARDTLWKKKMIRDSGGCRKTRSGRRAVVWVVV